MIYQTERTEECSRRIFAKLFQYVTTDRSFGVWGKVS